MYQLFFILAHRVRLCHNLISSPLLGRDGKLADGTFGGDAPDLVAVELCKPEGPVGPGYNLF